MDKTWIRWGIAFCATVLLVEGLMLRSPAISSEKTVAEQQWELPATADRSHVIASSEKIAKHMAWGLQPEVETLGDKSVSWELKGIVKVGSNLLALVSVDNKLSRMQVGESIMNSRIEAIEVSGITVSEVDEAGATQTRFVKIHR